MKILLFTSSFPYGNGEQFLETEIKFLSKRFCSITIFPCTYGGDFVRRETPQNVKIVKPFIDSNFKRFINIKFLFLFANKAYRTIIISELRKSVKSNNIKNFAIAFNLAYYCLKDPCLLKEMKAIGKQDIVYFYWGNGASYMLPFLEPTLGIKVMRLHGGDLYEELYNNYIPFRKEQLIHCDHIIPISHHGLAYIVQKYPFTESKTTLSRLGIMPNKLRYQKKNTKFHLVSCSSLISVKRVSLIVDILRHLNTELSIKWTHIGKGELKSQIEKEAAMLPDNISVEFKGHLSNNNVLKFYQTNWVDLFVNVSESEGIPVSIMEASSFGIPSLATDVGGTSEIVNENTGILLEKHFDTHIVSKLLSNIISKKIIINRKRVQNEWKEKFNAKDNYQLFCNLLIKLGKN